MRKFLRSEIFPQGESIHLAFINPPFNQYHTEHTHDFFECFIVKSGYGFHLVSGKEYPLEVGDLWFIRPEHSHGFKSTKAAHLAFYNIALDTEVVHSTFAQHPAFENPWSSTPLPTATHLTTYQRDCLMNLIREAAASPREPLDATLFSLGLCRLLRPIEKGTMNSTLPAWLQEALLLARKPENIQIGLPQLIKLCGRSKEHVCRTFKEYLGQTPSEWLNNERVRYARHLLEITQRSIIEVSLDCGYESLNYFHRCFKNVTGKTPLQYRKSANKVQLSD